MNTVDFIEKNIIAELTRQGFDQTACQMGAREGVAYFHRASSMGKKGKVFDDCLLHAKILAKQYASNQKKSLNRPKNP